MQFMAQQRLYRCVGYDAYAMRMMWTRNADGSIDVAGLAWQGILSPARCSFEPYGRLVA